MTDLRYSKFVVMVNALIPLALMLFDVYRGRAGANPLEFVTRTTGMLALVFMILTLAVTPFRRTFALNIVVRFRRMLGLFAFFYGSLHLLTYVAFDRYFDLTSVPRDVAGRPFIAVGMLAFFLMVPLAITSTNKMVKRIGGKRWNQLHRLVYVGGIAAVLHFWLLVKSDTRLPLTFAFILLLLLGQRLMVKFYKSVPPRSSVSIFPED